MIRQKTWSLGVGLYSYIKHFKPLDQFQYNLAEMFLWWPSFKIQFKLSRCGKKNMDEGVVGGVGVGGGGGWGVCVVGGVGGRGGGWCYKIYTKILEQWTWLKLQQ